MLRQRKKRSIDMNNVAEDSLLAFINQSKLITTNDVFNVTVACLTLKYTLTNTVYIMSLLIALL